MWDSTLLRGAVPCSSAMVDYGIVSAVVQAITAEMPELHSFEHVLIFINNVILHTDDQSADALFVILESGDQEGYGFSVSIPRMRRLVAIYVIRVCPGFLEA